VLGPRSLGQLSRRRLAVRAVLYHDRRLAEGHRGHVSSLANAASEIDSLRERFTVLAEQLAAIEAASDAGEAERQALVAAVVADRDVGRAAALELKAAGDGVAAATARDAPWVPKGGASEPHEPFSSGRGALLPPARGRIRWRFGQLRDARFPAAGKHSGVAILAERGAPVRAVWEGRVAFSGWLPGRGQVVILEHDKGWHTIYGHLATASVRAGQTVARRALLGQVGRTGSWAGPLLTFELRRGAAPVDPRGWLRSR